MISKLIVICELIAEFFSVNPACLHNYVEEEGGQGVDIVKIRIKSFKSYQ